MQEKNTDGQNMGSEARNISRRNFLKLAAGAIVAVPLVIKGLEKVFYEALISGIKNPDINDKATSAALKVSEGAPNSENPNYRSMVDIIREGISVYSEKTGQPVFFQRIEGYKDSKYYTDVIKRFTSLSLMPQLPDKIIDELIFSFPRGAREAYSQSWYTIINFGELFASGSGFDARLRARHPGLVRETGLYFGIDRIPEPISQEGKQEIDELKQRVEEKNKEIGKPISASFVLAHFLEKNNGNLSQSIFDTAIFLKFMARNDLGSGNYSPNETFNIRWYKQNIKDEYQGPTYASPPEGEAVINLIGKPYHGWNLVALLQFFPVEVVRIGGIQKLRSTFKEQGLGKTRSDLQTLKDLRETEQMLLSYYQAGSR